MKNLKSFNKKNSPGFMLMEVLITLTIVSMIVMPVYMLISNSLGSSYRFYKKRERVFAMKNLLLTQMYKANEPGEQEGVVNKNIKRQNMSLVYMRDVAKKDKIFEAIPEKQLQNLCTQKVIATFGSRRERDNFGCLLYKPNV